MSQRTIIKVLTPTEIEAALVHHVLSKQGITYTGELRYIMTGDASKTVRVEVTIDTNHIQKS